jgi:hypothetical protein
MPDFRVSDLSMPADWSARLSRMGFRCRKRFPAMHCDLRSLRRVPTMTWERVTDYTRLEREEHR